MPEFKLVSDMPAAGDQPHAIDQLVEGLLGGEQAMTLLGVTGSGKTRTMAGVIERLGRPALVMAPNKTLAAQLTNEFKELFPHNAVEYFDQMLHLEVGHEYDRDAVLRKLVDIHYDRNDLNFVRGKFRVRGDTLEVFPAYEERAMRVEFFGDEVERILVMDPVSGEIVGERDPLFVFPASHYVAGTARMERAIASIEVELRERLAELEREGKLLEAQRLRMRTSYDLEMLRE